jgi:hypothetical protein
MAEEQKQSGYGKRPIWQWILLYVVIGAIVYGLVYYFIISKKSGDYTLPGGNNYGASQNSNSTGNTGYSY